MEDRRMAMAASCSILDVHNGSAGGPVPRLAGFALPISAIFRGG